MKQCVYLRIRSKNYQKYKFCKYKNKIISGEDCIGCLNRINLFANSIKRKSKKLRKLEKNRKSILTNDLKTCYICGKKATSIHEIYKGSNRKISMINNFCVPLCDKCHINTETCIEILRYLQRECQKEYEKTHTRDEFLRLIGRNFL